MISISRKVTTSFCSNSGKLRKLFVEIVNKVLNLKTIFLWKFDKGRWYYKDVFIVKSTFVLQLLKLATQILMFRYAIRIEFFIMMAKQSNYRLPTHLKILLSPLNCLLLLKKLAFIKLISMCVWLNDYDINKYSN